LTCPGRLTLLRASKQRPRLVILRPTRAGNPLLQPQSPALHWAQIQSACGEVSMRGSAILMFGLVLTVAGCAVYPENASFLYGERYHVARLNTFPTRITEVDGRSTLTTQNPVQIEPGRHLLTLTTAPAAGFGAPEYRNLDLEVEPCKRYYLVAERDNRLLQDWRPIIDHIRPVSGPGCS
jgi:hypothetical protein